MKKALIVTAHAEKLQYINISPADFDCVICADGGLLVAEKLGLTPDLLIGDYDSMKQPENCSVIKLPMEKDMTDSEAAIDLAFDKGYMDITLIGGLGGRFDHTMGNIGMLAKYCGRLDRIALLDGQNYVYMLLPGSYSIKKNDYKYLGVISYGNVSSGVTLKGVKYPLTDYRLTNDTTLGVSNEIVDDIAEISFNDGILLIILSKDVDF